MLLLAGCTMKIPGRPEVFPVSGQIFVRGVPAAKAVIQLRAPGNQLLDHWRPHAIVGSDGSFHLTTFATDDGAPAGTYALTVTWPRPGKRPFDSEGPDRFKGRYADPLRPVCELTIRPAKNDLGRINLP